MNDRLIRTDGCLDANVLVVPRPRGFCAGVVRAIDIVRLALEELGAPIYVRKEIVHNRHVVAELAERGAVFVDELDQVPNGSVVVFSAHGVAPGVWTDATRFTVVLIGHRDHDEVLGTIGEAPDAIQVISSLDEVDLLDVPDPQRVAYLTQTTLSVDDTQALVDRLKQRFPALVGPPDQDICYATQNRQNAVKLIASRVQVILVVGAQNSSNSNRLVEVAQRAGTRAYLIESVADIDAGWIEGCTRIGITAGASTPDSLVAEVIRVLRSRNQMIVEEVTVVDEDVRFSLPRELRAREELSVQF